MTVQELTAILRHADPDSPVCWHDRAAGITLEIGAVVALPLATYFPSDALVARGPVVVAFDAS